MRYYDIFLILHILLALGVLVTLFYHTKIFEGEFDGFLWPCVAFWVFDRTCRIGRVLYFTFRRGKLAKATVEYSEEDEIMRIDVTDVLKGLHCQGGLHFFL